MLKGNGIFEQECKNQLNGKTIETRGHQEVYGLEAERKTTTTQCQSETKASQTG